jgi:hypothetical protein
MPEHTGLRNELFFRVGLLQLRIRPRVVSKKQTLFTEIYKDWYYEKFDWFPIYYHDNIVALFIG